MKICSSTIALLIALMCPTMCFAWGDSGHMAIALRAWDEMSPGTRAAAVELLKQHPRYQPDFVEKMPADVAADDRDRWLFMFAATWPDNVSKLRFSAPGAFHKYFHGTWHVQGREIALDPKDQASLPPLPVPADTDIDHLTIAEALPLMLAQLNDQKRAPGDRAVALCWVEHLIGDLHEPCHAASLVCNRWKAPDGDHVAVKLPIAAPGWPTHMHQFWDNTYAMKVDYPSVQEWDRQMLANPALQRDKLPELTSDPNIADWISESYHIAERDVYSPEIRSAIAVQDADVTKRFEPVHLSDAYIANALRIGKERGVLAGLRIADTLASVHW